MKKNAQLLLAVMTTALLSTTAMANNTTIKVGGISITKPAETDMQPPIDDIYDSTEEANVPDYVGAGATMQAPSNQPRSARELQQEMENDIKIGGYVDPEQKKEDSSKTRTPEEFAEEELNKKENSAKTSPENAEPSKTYAKPKKVAILYGSTSTFNTQTIQHIEAQAAQRDEAAYQEFLRNSHNK